MKRAEALEAKLEAAEKALKEAQEKAQSEEKRWEEENARLATCDKDIRERLDALSSSLISKDYCDMTICFFVLTISTCFLNLLLTLDAKITDYSLQLGKGQ